MSTEASRFEVTVRLLKARANTYALYGVAIAAAAAVIATLVVAWVTSGAITVSSIAAAQRDNPALWLLDAMPFLFALWGQYTGLRMAYSASALALDDTEALRNRALGVSGAERYGVALSGVLDGDTFVRALDGAIGGKTPPGSVAVLVLDLQDFQTADGQVKQNRRRGDILQAVADRLKGAVRDRDLIGHFSEDSFGVLIQGLKQRSDLDVVARRIRHTLRPPLPLGGGRVQISPVIGSVLYPEHGTEVSALLRNADAARDKARRSEIGYASYEAPEGGETEPASALEAAVAARALNLVFVPQVDSEGRATHLRVTMISSRSNDASHDQILSIAAERAELEDLLRWYTDRVCRTLNAIPAAQRPRAVLPLATYGPRIPDAASVLAEAVEEHELSCEQMVVETVPSEEASETLLRAVRECGFAVALGEFGGAAGRFASMLESSFDEIRLAPGPVEEALAGRTDAFTRGVAVATALGAVVVSPGADSPGSPAQLRKLGADRLEGVALARKAVLAADQEPDSVAPELGVTRSVHA